MIGPLPYTDGPSLAAGAATHPVQTVRAHVSLPQQNRLRYLTELTMPVGVTRHRLRSASSTDLVMPATSFNSWRSRVRFFMAREHGIVYLLLSAPMPHTTFSKKTTNLTFLDYPIHCDIVYFDYVQRSFSSLYCLLRFTSCPTYITLHYEVLVKNGFISDIINDIYLSVSKEPNLLLSSDQVLVLES